MGFLINPVAGMGGSVGLKGTDGVADKARALGARPVAPARARTTLTLLGEKGVDALFITASGEMGEDALQETGLSHETVYDTPGRTGAEDTIGSCAAFLDRGADLIIFCGGDGTARDVSDAVGTRVPILGIPAGVKMHSGVFAVSPEAAARLAWLYLEGELKTRETEVADVDEELYRRGVLDTKLYGVAKTPYAPALVQERKQVYSSVDEEAFKEEIGAFAREFMEDGSYYIFGAGTTTARITASLGVEKTLLGVDVIRRHELIVRDASEKDLLRLISGAKDAGKGVKVVVSPIGAQGFLLGRGSQQISAEVLRLVGVENLIVVATPHKLSELDQLLVDTGDKTIDMALSGRRQVVCGYRLAQLKEVRTAAEVK